MRRNRITIAAALGGVTILAIAMAAIREGTRPWTQAVESVVVIAKTAAIAGAFVARGGKARAFWVGFALFGWQFLASPMLPAPSAAQALALTDLARRGGLALHPYAETFVPPETSSGAPGEPTSEVVHGTAFDLARKVYMYDAGRRAHYSALAIMGVANLLYAMLGGWIAMALASRRMNPDDDGGAGGRP